MVSFTWQTNDELERLRRDIERLFDDFGWSSGRDMFSRLTSRAVRSYPLVNMFEDEDNVYVEALAPGVNPESLELNVVRDTLRISGEKAYLSDGIRPEDFHRNERDAGKFSRLVSLPSTINVDAVTADYTNGILHIMLPKAEEAKPKHIEINVG